MSEPLLPALHLFASRARLRPGLIVRVGLAAEPGTMEGVLRTIDSDGISVEERRPFFKTAADWTADGPRTRDLQWSEVGDMWIRTHAVGRGSLWAAALALLLGWCGDTMDHLTDGTPRAELVYAGLGVGLVLGAVIALLGHEWRRVDLSTTP